MQKTAQCCKVLRLPLCTKENCWLAPCTTELFTVICDKLAASMSWKISPPFPSFSISKVPITMISAAYWMLTLNLDIKCESVYWRQMWKARISLVSIGLLGRSQLPIETLSPKWLNLSSLHNLCYVWNVLTGLYAVSLVLTWGVVFLEGLGTLGGGTPLMQVCNWEECAHRLYLADSLLLWASCRL